MLLLLVVCALATAFDVHADQHIHLRRSLGKKDKSDPPTLFPTTIPTDVPTNSPIEIMGHRPIEVLAEICNKKNGHELDVCIEWLASTAPSAASPALSAVPTTSPTLELIGLGSPTNVPSRDVHLSAVQDHDDRILIELGYFDMTLSIVSESIRPRTKDAMPQYRQSGDLTRQYEHAAARRHLHEVYTESFLNPLVSLNLTFIDAGETNISESSTRSSIFYGSVVFEKVEGYIAAPTKSELDYATSIAFIGKEKDRFLDVFRRYYVSESADTFTYDVIVQKLGQSSDFSPELNDTIDMENTNDQLPLIPIIAAALTLCIAGSAYFIRRRRIHKRSNSKISKSVSPMQIRVFGELESDDDEMVGCDAKNIHDAYMDSASIRSKSPGDSSVHFAFGCDNFNTLRELGVAVESEIPTVVDLDDESIDASELR